MSRIDAASYQGVRPDLQAASVKGPTSLYCVTGPNRERQIPDFVNK